MEKSSYIASVVDKNNLVDTNATYAKLVAILSKALKVDGGTSTAAALNALTSPMEGLLIELTDSGTLTLGTLSVVATDVVYFTGLVWKKAEWVTVPGGVELVTDNKTLTAADNGKTFKIATDAKAFTLPLITASMVSEGTEFTFINTGADGAVALTLSPNALDGINGTIANAAADSVASGVVNKDLVNTKATANNMDYVKIKAIALTKWGIVGGVGIHASEA